MEIAPHISVDPGVCHGVPVISGTRVPVAIVVGSLGSGMSEDEVVEEYGITGAEVDAALSYAAVKGAGPTSITPASPSDEDWRRAAAIPSFPSDVADLGKNHDKYLAEAFESWLRS